MNQSIFDNISHLIDLGAFLEAEQATIDLLKQIERKDDGTDAFVIFNFNAAGFLVDIAHALSNREHARRAVKIFGSLESKIEGAIDSHLYLYLLPPLPNLSSKGYLNSHQRIISPVSHGL